MSPKAADRMANIVDPDQSDLCWGLTSQSTIFQSCQDGATTSWVINQYFRGVKCLAQGHNTAAVGFEPPTSRSGVRLSTTEPPRSPQSDLGLHCLLRHICPKTWDYYSIQQRLTVLSCGNMSMTAFTSVELHQEEWKKWWHESRHDKTILSVRPAKTQISLGIRPVWSESLLALTG